ncbi:MAG: AAA family ATPase [Devosia sp.]|nr:AAA family ATPase [Devosia sp.]
MRTAAYNARASITDERTGELYYFKHRDQPESHEVLLPEGADPALAESSALWNAAEAAEKRKDAQVARELVIALPANHEVSHEDRVAMVRSFAEEHFVSRGLGVQLDIHGPHVGDEASETANHHAHLLITTRRIEGDRLSAKKARDLDPEVKLMGGRAAVTDGEAWGALWRDHQNRYFIEHGMDVRVDQVSAVPQEHVGPVRMRAPESAAVARAEAVARENAAAAREPEKVLGVLTRNNATFTERELDRFLGKHISDEAEHLAVKAKVLGSANTLALHDRETGEATGRYTTREVRDQERAAIGDAEGVAKARHRAIGGSAASEALVSRSLRDDQKAAFDHALGSGGLKIVEGRAGTGKSYTLGAVREAHERAGYEVIGLGPTNSVAQDLKADGFAQSATVHSELFRLKNGRSQWTARTLVVVDEAAMLDSRMTGELLAEAKRSGAKLILAGDDRQLASIERGGLFTELRQRHGSAEITEVTRQKVDWQRQAARDLAEGRVAEAVQAFAREGAISWTETQDQARTALVERWKADGEGAPTSSQFVFAYTNADVDALNADLRAVRRERGELGEDVALMTKHGQAEFAVGDRVQFTDTLRGAKIYNGNAGVITGIDGQTGVLRAQLDDVGGKGREVVWSASEFDGFRHGYAGTIYKGQGKTLDRTYLYHSHHWRQSSSYVALTRQRESAQIFAATETARDVAHLARQMGRGEVRSASVAWATRDELGLGSLVTQRPEAQPLVASPGDDLTAAAAKPARRKREAQAEGTEPRWLIAPNTAGDPPTAAEVAAAVSGDGDVRREREALGRYLAGAYRDPTAAGAQLEALVARDGPTSAAQRIGADPGQLGELQGKVGLFVSASGRQAREQAERVAQAVGPAVARRGQAESFAAKTFSDAFDARRLAEATGVPKLSDVAQAAVSLVAGASDEAGRTAAWRALQDNKPIGGEVNGFMAAVERRFGADGLRSFDRLGTIEGDGPRLFGGAVLGQIGKIVQAVRGAERSAAGETMRLNLSQKLGLGSKLKP